MITCSRSCRLRFWKKVAPNFTSCFRYNYREMRTKQPTKLWHFLLQFVDKWHVLRKIEKLMVPVQCRYSLLMFQQIFCDFLFLRSSRHKIKLFYAYADNLNIGVSHLNICQRISNSTPGIRERFRHPNSNGI
jgi:hypothetical protein